jgi:hypothetical protein
MEGKMAMIKCPECKKEMSSQAEACPHCGAKQKKGCSIGCLTSTILVSLVIFVIFLQLGKSNQSSVPHRTSESKRANLISEMYYLNKIEEIEWVEIVSNTIYIGFKSVPSDLKLICNAAALKGNRTINFGVHVWAIDSNKFQKGWRPGDGTYYYEVTARNGELE